SISFLRFIVLRLISFILSSPEYLDSCFKKNCPSVLEPRVRLTRFESTSVLPELAGTKNSYRRYDPANQFRRRDVESRIHCAARRICQTHKGTSGRPFRTRHCAPGPEHFARFTLLNRNLQTGLQIPINGRER